MQHTGRPKPAPFHLGYSPWAGSGAPWEPSRGAFSDAWGGVDHPLGVACMSLRGEFAFAGPHSSRGCEVESSENASWMAVRFGRGPPYRHPSRDFAGVGMAWSGESICMMGGPVDIDVPLDPVVQGRSSCSTSDRSGPTGEMPGFGWRRRVCGERGCRDARCHGSAPSSCDAGSRMVPRRLARGEEQRSGHGTLRGAGCVAKIPAGC